MKSPVKDFLELVQAVYIDCCAQCSIIPDLRDVKLLRHRAENEGLSFLTISLPLVAAGLEAGLRSGISDPLYFPNFRCRGRYPEFLQGFFGLVFGKGTGRLHLEPSVLAIRCIRQLCMMFKKLRYPCTPERERAAFSRFKEVEHDFHTFSAPMAEGKSVFDALSSLMWNDILAGFNSANIICHHGPGATADGLSGNRKFVHRTWPDRLDVFFPLEPTAYVINAVGSREVKGITILARGSELPSKVVSVPKTLKSPRIIACEPTAMQLAQQGLKDFIVKSIESAALTCGHVNFTDQRINQELAVSSSIDGRLATIDLSDASDRVPLSLVEDMLHDYPDFLGAVLACRSERARLPDGEIISLQKFASMGSALCFPIESMYFYTICVAARLVLHRLPVTFSNVFKVSRDVFVYGDDIIFPADEVDFLLGWLQDYNCKVNTNKSFWTGKFRESCGMDSYDGHRVTPVYVREVLPQEKRSFRSLISASSTANQLFTSGFYRAAECIHARVHALLGYYPSGVGTEFSGLGRSYPYGRNALRLNADTHSPEVRAWVPVAVRRTDKLRGYAALQKCLTLLNLRKEGEVSVTDPKHLERSARHGDVALKLRWVPLTKE